MAGHIGGLDVEKIREDFPILDPHGRRSTARLSGQRSHVAEAPSGRSTRSLTSTRHHNANAHRGLYMLGEEATELFEGARAEARRILRCPIAGNDRVHARRHGVDQPGRAGLGSEVPA